MSDKSKYDCGCPFAKFPKKYQVPVKTEDGHVCYIMISQEEFDKLKEKIEIREVFK